MSGLAMASNSWERLKAFVLDGLVSQHSRRAYSKAWDDFLAWSDASVEPYFGKGLVQAYRSSLIEKGLAPATVNVRLAAIRKFAAEAADSGLIAPEAAAGIARVGGARRSGVRAGNWLTRDQCIELLRAPDTRALKGKRDRAILAVLTGCGLRRSELASLTDADIQRRDGRWVIVDLSGKGCRVRAVPVPHWVKLAIDEWTESAGIGAGRLFRSVNKAGRVSGEALTEKAIWSIVREYARQIGVTNLAPHDLRRTCAKLCRAAGGDLEQIQFLLGHASIQTTERYLGTRQNLTHAVNDDLGLD